MRHRSVLFAWTLAAIVLSTGLAAAQSNVGGAATDVKNEKAVRERYTQFVAAWNRHDAAALGAMFAVDGDLIEPDGAHEDGRDAVTLHFKQQHESVFKKTNLMLSIADVWFITGEVALVDGGYAISGIVTPDGTQLPERRGHITSVLLLENGQWSIVASRLMVPTELPYKR